MKLLADENVPLEAVALLRNKGYDVLSVGESMPRLLTRTFWRSQKGMHEFCSLLIKISGTLPFVLTFLSTAA
jgi:hypothetical protein